MKFLKLSFNSVVLLVVFIVSFFISTIIFDSLDKATGYYDEGRKESAEVYS